MTMDNKQLQQEIRFLILSALDDFSKDLEQKGDGFAAASLPSFLKKRNQPIFFTAPISYWPDRIEMYSDHAPIMEPLPVSDWSGEGLPPVGTVCEVNYCEDWHVCEVIAHFQQPVGIVAAFVVDICNGGHRGVKALDAFTEEHFRPALTPEQIAADQRQSEINEMIYASLVGHHAITIAQARIVSEVLHKAGYRKQATP